MQKSHSEDCNCGKPASGKTVTISFYDRGKFGKCKKCILIAVIGTLIGWLMYFLALIEPNMPIIYKSLVLVVPVPFSCLLIIHAIFKTLKRRRDP